MGGSDGTRSRGRRGAAADGPQHRVGRSKPARRGVDSESVDTARTEAAVDSRIGRERRDPEVVERGDGHARAPCRAQPRRGRHERRIVDDEEPEIGMHDVVARRRQHLDAETAGCLSGDGGASDRDTRRDAQGVGEMDRPDQVSEADARARGDAERNLGRGSSLARA